MKRAIRTLLVGALVAGALTLATPVGAATNGKLLFVRAGDLYTINPNGSGVLRLTTTGGISDASYSPNRTRIAFVRAGDIWTMTSAGANVQRVTTNASQEWSPTWSPDGVYLEFVSNRTDFPAGSTNFSDIFRVRSTVPYGTAKQITHARTEAEDTGYERVRYVDVNWHPTNAGRILATRGLGFVTDPTDFVVSVFSSTTGARLVPGRLGRDGDWSPNATRVAYTYDDCAYDGGNFSVRTFQVGGSGGTTVTPCNADATLPSTLDPIWSPDGTTIAYYQQSANAIWFATPAGANKRQFLANARLVDWAAA